MRTLNDIFLSVGTYAAINTASEVGSIEAVTPESGRLVGGYINVGLLTTANHSFDIMVNGVDTLIDMDFPVTVADRGIIMNMLGTVEVNVGDRINLRSNNETATASTTADAGVIIRR